ncbi:hypothetical protein G7046_g7616 [Stylonectria norvegica]|nr:hypothetical protein G7046_g7616 [Stylonectria norvegica]
MAQMRPLEHAVDVFDGPAEEVFSGGVVELGVADEVPDGLLQCGVCLELGGLLLGDDGVVGEVVVQGGDDEGLGAEVADGDGGLVILVDGALRLFVEDALGEDGGALDGELCDLQFSAVGGGHGCGCGRRSEGAEVGGELEEAAGDGGGGDEE